MGSVRLALGAERYNPLSEGLEAGIGPMDEKRSPARICFIIAGVLLAACPALMWLFAQFSDALFPLYRNFSKAWIALLAGVTGIVPFALWDIGVLVLAVAALIALVRCIFKRCGFALWLSLVALALSATLFSFVGGWALNHYAPPLAQEIGLDTRESTIDELADATAFYLEQAARSAPLVPRDAEGRLVRQDFFEIASIAGSSYAVLEERHDIFYGSHSPVKALLAWGEPLLYSGHIGIFWAPTGEPAVPLNCADADRPFTMCHEAAHRLAIASEEEANFAAFLACEASDDARFIYSGYYHAFVYCFDALYAASPECAQELLEEIAASDLYEGAVLVFSDRAATRAHYDAYEGPFEEVGTAVNDGYLRSFGEESGVKSYGLVVDYLIAWHESGSAAIALQSGQPSGRLGR
ncbi:DUF3810 domain-containing protein [Coriobacteriales bacterium OH1046]|nr:DUF3810 domain-containing protein [Coriobacteriales bacterium OH1046]